MRRLILLRHAKSSWKEPGLADHDRPLNKRGRNGAERIGRWLEAGGYRPDHALVSSALRARQTWEIVTRSIGPVPTTLERALYHAPPDLLLAALRRAPESASLLMLGHQPGIGAFARQLLDDVPEDRDFARFPTGAAAVIDFDIAAWDAAERGLGRLVGFGVPRALA